MQEKSELPTTITSRPSPRPQQTRYWLVTAGLLLWTFSRYFLPGLFSNPSVSTYFYHNISITDIACPGVTTHSGYIGLKGDSEETPKREFFWYFPAENDAENAPVILTIGGGPGTSGMMNPVFGQSACVLTKDGLARNPDRWNEHFNLVALDHPVGVGFAYGTSVNNSRDAAFDVYDFFQKFFKLYPELGKNRFYVSGGSYGGVYVPNIATVIQEQNALSIPGNVHINLEALLVSNPLSDPSSYFGWYLHYMCQLHNIYNSTTCAELYAVLPQCLEQVELAMMLPTIERKHAAIEVCGPIADGDFHGHVREDIRRVCISPKDDPLACHPEIGWALDTFNNGTIRAALGIPDSVTFKPLNMDVNSAFQATADLVSRHYLMYEDLLKSGIRVLHWIGAQDANCAWPGILHFLKLIRTPFQGGFLSTPDTVWGEGEMTVRAIGPGAGNMTYLLLDGAGHFVVKDQSKLAKYIVETWVENEPWF